MVDDAVTTAQRRHSRRVTPEGWRSIRLGEAFEVVVDRGHSQELPVLSVTLDRGVVRRSSLDRSSEREVDRDQYLRALPRDIAYNTMRMWQGGSGLVREEGYLSPAYTVCRSRAGEWADFWAQCFKSSEMIRAFLDHSQGVAKDRYRLYFHHFATVPALRPPSAEQRKIAAILSSIDETIEATQAVIDQLGVVKKAMMAELLTHGIPGRHTRFKRTEIGEVPEEWAVVSVGDAVSHCDYGISTPLSSSVGDVGVLRMGNIFGGAVVLNDLKFTDRSSIPDGLLLRAGDVLFNRTNSRDLVGKVGVFRGADRDISFASYLLRLRPSRSVEGEWLSLAMNLEQSQAKLRAMATPGVSQVNINRSKMLTLLIGMPPADEQMAIVRAIGAIESRMSHEQSISACCSSLKSALMSVLLTGDLRVKPDEAAP